jgi:hypothetical protein
MSDSFSKGDLLRMCTTTEIAFDDPSLITWCYGLYIETVESDTCYDGHCATQADRFVRILCESRIQAFDHYWHIERVS